MDLYIHVSIHLHGMILRHRGNFIFTFISFQDSGLSDLLAFLVIRLHIEGYLYMQNPCLRCL